MNRLRTLLALPAVALLTLATLALALPSEPPAPAPDGRVVILGFDGADARTVRELMEADPSRYPNFHKLAAEGTFEPLEVVVPAESPVSWASLNSGQNPAKTGVPGFIKRNILGSMVLPGFGYIEKPKAVPLEEFAENAPLPLWSPATTAAVWGGAAFLAVLVLGLILFRKLPLAAALALAVGGGAAFAGRQARTMLPTHYPRTTNVNKVESFWDHAARGGARCVVLDAAQSFDGPTTSGAKVLHGLGLPDARGDLGQWFIYTTDPAEFSREGKGTTTAGTVYRVDEEGGTIRSKIYGPKNFWQEQQLEAQLKEVEEEIARNPADAALKTRKADLSSRLKQAGENMWLEMVIELEDGAARVAIDGQSQTLKPGDWSEFYELSFPLNWMVKVDAITRVKLVQLEPHFEVLVNVLDIDPRNPPFWQPISSPHGFASELAADCGLYETYGWPTLTMPFKDKKIEPEVLLEDVEFTCAWREKLTHQRLGMDDWDCFMSVFSTTDRVQHMMYQYYDEGHPRHDPEVAARETTFFGERIKLSEAIPAIYRQMDRIIGDVMAKLRPEDTLIVISDHGFQSFRHQVHINNWLIENGYLAVKPGLSRKNKEALQFVDWANTRAYSLGLGFIYLNLEGREPKGIVPRDEARALMEELRGKLLAAKDPSTGKSICSEVYFPRDIHPDGEYYGLEADLVTGFAAPYRVGWSTSSGGVDVVEENGIVVPGPFISDNDSNWSGGHVSMDLNDIKGVFFSNRKVQIPAQGVRALQIAPTALSLLGVEIPKEMDLPPLEFGGVGG